MKTITISIGIIALIALFVWSLPATAGPYAGVYWINTNTDTVSGAEVDHDVPGAAFVIGARSTGKYGAYGEAGLSQEGVLGAAAVYMMTGDVEWSLGAAAIPDTSDGQTRLGVDQDTAYGVGPMIGVRYKWLVFRAAQYDVDHSYHVDQRDDEGNIIDSAQSQSTADRQAYWLGVRIPLD